MELSTAAISPQLTLQRTPAAASVSATSTISTVDQVCAKYGDWICDAIGAETILKLPEVTWMQLQLREDAYYQARVLPKCLGDYSAARYVDQSDRAGIVFRCVNGKGIEFVELLQQRHEGRWGRDNYVSSLAVLGTDGKVHSSYLDKYRYSSGGMSQEDLKQVGNLLAGAEVNFSARSPRHLKMAQPRALTPQEHCLVNLCYTFCNAVGLDLLTQLPTVSAAQIGLVYKSLRLDPSGCSIERLPEKGPVLFVDDIEPVAGIAIPVRRYDPTTDSHIECVECIYLSRGSSHKAVSTRPSNIPNQYASDLFHSDILDSLRFSSPTSSQLLRFELVKALLQGETIRSATDSGVTLEMIRPVPVPAPASGHNEASSSSEISDPVVAVEEDASGEASPLAVAGGEGAPVAASIGEGSPSGGSTMWQNCQLF